MQANKIKKGKTASNKENSENEQVFLVIKGKFFCGNEGGPEGGAQQPDEQADCKGEFQPFIKAQNFPKKNYLNEDDRHAQCKARNILFKGRFHPKDPIKLKFNILLKMA
ncbi:MAG: hypothetical protein Kow0037_26130 [Calditrichia bacterium]